MTTLKVTEQGQVAFGIDVLEHLALQPGDKIRHNPLWNGRAELTAEQPQGSWDALKNFFAGKTNGRQLSTGDFKRPSPQLPPRGFRLVRPRHEDQRPGALRNRLRYGVDLPRAATVRIVTTISNAPLDDPPSEAF